MTAQMTQKRRDEVLNLAMEHGINVWQDMSEGKEIGSTIESFVESITAPLEHEILNLHSRLAGAVLHVEQGWARYEEKNKAVLAMERRIAELEASQHIPGADEK